MPLNVRQRQPIAAFWYLALAPILFSVVIIAASFFFAAYFPDTIASLIVFFALLMACAAVIYPLLYYLLFSYELHEHTITINSGILFRQYETINFNKIQALNNERDPILMLFGLTRVEIWTASWDQLAPNTGTLGQIRSRPDTRLFLHKDEASKLRDFVMHSKK